jgi:hypothetical protein
MPISLHELAIDTFIHMLGDLTHVLDKATKHAQARNFPVDDLARFRLAPDMYPLSTQVYLACFYAKDGPARLLGQEAGMPERGLQETFEQAGARLKATLDHLRRIPKGALDGAEQRKITIEVNPERVFDLTGFQLIRDWTLPHFYFHVVTAYDILRAAGVEIGKRDYAAHVAAYLRKP